MKSMVVLIDTNILIDVFQNREPFFESSYKVYEMCEQKKLKVV